MLGKLKEVSKPRMRYLNDLYLTKEEIKIGKRMRKLCEKHFKKKTEDNINYLASHDEIGLIVSTTYREGGGYLEIFVERSPRQVLTPHYRISYEVTSSKVFQSVNTDYKGIYDNVPSCMIEKTIVDIIQEFKNVLLIRKYF